MARISKERFAEGLKIVSSKCSSFSSCTPQTNIKYSVDDNDDVEGEQWAARTHAKKSRFILCVNMKAPNPSKVDTGQN